MSAKTGRPKSEGPIRSATIPVKVTPAQKELIEAAAQQANKSVSTFIADVVMASLAVPTEKAVPEAQKFLRALNDMLEVNSTTPLLKRREVFQKTMDEYSARLEREIQTQQPQPEPKKE